MSKTTKYDDIIDLPHHQSKNHPQMSMLDRAAQFSPFAALTGFEAEIAEEARLTDAFIQLSDNSLEEINLAYQRLEEAYQKGERVCVEITYFSPDLNKQGGAYNRVEGLVKKLDEYERMIRLEGDITVPMDMITELHIKKRS